LTRPFDSIEREREDQVSDSENVVSTAFRERLQGTQRASDAQVKGQKAT